MTQNYFRDKVAIYYANTYKAERKVSIGCPQGPCCGPGLWNVLYNALLNLDFSRHTKVIAFADDLAIISEGQRPTETEAYANSELAGIENLAKENKWRFNETKSKATLLSTYRINDTINVYLNNRRLDQVTEMKYLGIYFDRRLTFDKHIENIAEKSTTMTHMLGKSAKFHWVWVINPSKLFTKEHLSASNIWSSSLRRGCWETQKPPQVAKSTEADDHRNCQGL